MSSELQAACLNAAALKAVCTCSRCRISRTHMADRCTSRPCHHVGLERSHARRKAVGTQAMQPPAMGFCPNPSACMRCVTHTLRDARHSGMLLQRTPVDV
jgi:hypothetical protein